MSIFDCIPMKYDLDKHHIMRPRILMLGASEAQMVALERAKALGMYVLTADNLPDNPGHALSDVF
jgi:hypothetical protein